MRVVREVIPVVVPCCSTSCPCLSIPRSAFGYRGRSPALKRLVRMVSEYSSALVVVGTFVGALHIPVVVHPLLVPKGTVQFHLRHRCSITTVSTSW